MLPEADRLGQPGRQLELELRLTGWHRIFASVGEGSSFRYALSGREAIRDVPDESWRPGNDVSPEPGRPLEHELPPADLTGRSLRLMMNGAQRAWVRALRFVAMTDSEVRERLSMRCLASGSGLSFAGYLEPISVRYYCAFALGLREHLRNEMRLNAERFVCATVRSVLAQEGFDLEVILVDDGSTDGSGDVARRFGVRVERLPECAGAAAARRSPARKSHCSTSCPGRTARAAAAAAREAKRPSPPNI